MKKIMMALVLIVMAYFGAYAQTAACNTRSLTKHASPMHKHKALDQSSNTLGVLERQTTTTYCRVVPYQVCKINPDRRSVSCYETVDPDEQVAMDPNEVTRYGPTGAMPGSDKRVAPGTIVINAPTPTSYCKRNKDNNATICYTPGDLTRDDLGFYHISLEQ